VTRSPLTRKCLVPERLLFLNFILSREIRFFILDPPPQSAQKNYLPTLWAFFFASHRSPTFLFLGFLPMPFSKTLGGADPRIAFTPPSCTSVFLFRWPYLFNREPVAFSVSPFFPRVMPRLPVSCFLRSDEFVRPSPQSSRRSGRWSFFPSFFLLVLK